MLFTKPKQNPSISFLSLTIVSGSPPPLRLWIFIFPDNKIHFSGFNSKCYLQLVHHTDLPNDTIKDAYKVL